jgi:hypothetical protein
MILNYLSVFFHCLFHLHRMGALFVNGRRIFYVCTTCVTRYHKCQQKIEVREG